MSKGKNTSSSTSTNRLRRYMKAPLRVLCPARDLYMSSMTSCAGAIKMEGIGYHMGGYMMASVPPPRGFSFTLGWRSCRRKDLELIHSASQRRAHSQGAPAAALRSHSVAVQRIDEDKPFEFRDEKADGEWFGHAPRIYADTYGNGRTKSIRVHLEILSLVLV